MAEKGPSAGDGKKTLVVILGAIVGISLLAVIGSKIGDGGSGSSGDATVTPGSREDAGQAGAPGASTFFDDRVPSVCRPGTYYERGGGMLRGSDGDAFCQSRRGNPIIIGLYSEQFKANNDLAMFRNQGFAVMTTSDGRLCVFISPSGTAALEPLTEFGFQLGTVQ